MRIPVLCFDLFQLANEFTDDINPESKTGNDSPLMYNKRLQEL